MINKPDKEEVSKLIDVVVGLIENKYMNLSEAEDQTWDLAELKKIIIENCKLIDPNGDRLNEDDFKKIHKRVRENISVTAKEANILVDQSNKRNDWYTDDFKKDRENFYWDRFEGLLKRNNTLSKGMLQRLDNDSSHIVRLLGNPELESYKVKGMVMGNVQSGKTLSYSAVINKAVDAGYKLIIILAGMTKLLRSQTQERINSDVIGKSYNEIDGSKQNFRDIGVGKINNKRKFSSILTTVKQDFNEMKRVSMNYETHTEPSAIVIKKNVSVLKTLNKHLQGQDLSLIPILLIDDESDNASVNTAKEDEDPKAINREVRNMLNNAQRITYLAYTATPMANIFIPPDGSDNEYEESLLDLFPSDFLVYLEPPTNYCGGEWFFLDEDKDENPLEEIEDNYPLMPAKHKKDFLIENLPESLIDAIGYFIIAGAIKDLRRDGGVLGRKKDRFDSCLINVSIFSGIQNDIRDVVRVEVKKIEESIRANSGLAQNNDKTLKRLKQVYEDKVAVKEYPWTDILLKLQKMDQLEVVSSNSVSSDGDLDWSDTAPSKKIVIGGYMMSRGLTLPGLTVSYFIRNSVMYDTLMQMGRWFGYRDGYKDLVKLWATPIAISHFSTITRALDELTSSIRLMRQAKQSPQQFGLRVKTHPDLMVTAKNKRRGAEDWDISLSFQGTHTQTWCFYRDKSIQKENENHTFRFLSKLKDKLIEDDDGHILFKDIVFKEVGKFLKDIKIHSHNGHIGSIGTSPDLLMKYLEKYEDSKFKDWDVAIYKKKSGDNIFVEEINNLFGIKVRYEKRAIRDDQSPLKNLISLTLNRGIAAAGASTVGLKTGLNKQDRKKPILIFHFLTAYINEKKEPIQDDLKNYENEKYIGISVLLPYSNERDDSVTYTINKVYWEQYIKEKWGDEDYEE